MGFVFNLENFIYLNKEFVLDQLNDNQFITRKILINCINTSQE